MGYTLIIGELETSINEEGLYSSISNSANRASSPDAPAYGEPTDGSNQRWPSYTSWHNAMSFIGLEDLIYNKEYGLLREHPGCVPLTQSHKEVIDKAYADFYAKYPNCKPGYSPRATDFEEDHEWPKENDYAVRLEWLKFWVDWALQNCKTPVFYNS